MVEDLGLGLWAPNAGIWAIGLWAWYCRLWVFLLVRRSSHVQLSCSADQAFEVKRKIQKSQLLPGY